MVRHLAITKVRELPSNWELDDLVSCGLVALIEAVDRYDPAKGASFEQYAWTRVSGSFIDELRKQDPASRAARRLARQVEGAREAYVSRTGLQPSEPELADAVGVSVAELRGRLAELDRARPVSLSAPAGSSDDGAAIEIGDTIDALEGRYDPELAALTGERTAALRDAIESLSEREREVLSLLHVHNLKGAEIGARMGFSESRVSQVASAIRAKLVERITAYDGLTAAPT